MDIIEYKCPSCGGSISFDSGTQQMVCPYCGVKSDVEALKSLDEALSKTTEDRMEWRPPENHWREGELDNMRIYACASCGGEIIGDETTAATSCPYCGSHVVIAGQFSGALRPNLVIPFKLDKNAAVEALKRHYKRKPLLPRVFKEDNHIQEIKGMYVPFWLFNADSDVDIRCQATKIQSWSDSEYNYTETSYFHVSRQGHIGFENVPADGASKMPDALMESIEPYHLQDAVDFQTAYLAGYLADKYDVEADRCVERANARIKKSAEDAFTATVTGYHTVTLQSSSVQLKSGAVRYALFPVWLLGTNWKGKRYMFAMNGQTGALAGDDLPISRVAWLIGMLISAAVFMPIVYFLIQYVLNS